MLVVVHRASILSAVPLTVKIRRSGGFAGITRETTGELAPGSAAHDGALRAFAAHRLRRAPQAAGRVPDGLRYEIVIASPRRTVLRRAFTDPLPTEIAALVDLVAEAGG